MNSRSLLAAAAGGLLTCVAPAPAAPCLWDSDTLATEAKGLPGIAEILTGRFERQPPRYYEMRLARVTASLASHPERLEDYDDAAVACDRLKRSDEAIAWMTKKAEALAKGAANSEHQYRYHANLGTFYAHRWIRAGANRADLADLNAAEEHIAKAIEINPDAHFGREKYQLIAIRWLLDGFDTPELEDYYSNNIHRRILATTQSGESAQGLAGLIVLGDAWQSVDIHWALANVLASRGEASLARLAQLRVRELRKDGKKSLAPGFNDDLITYIPGGRPDESNVSGIDSYFTRARIAADKWAAARAAYMESQFDLGKHPDTHPGFWAGWKETQPPALPDPVLLGLGWPELAAILTGVVMCVAPVAVVVRRRRAQK